LNAAGGIAAGKQASSVLVFVTRVEAVGGGAVAAGAGAGAAVAGEAAVDVVAGVGTPSLELLLDPQPLIAATKNINVGAENAARAFDLYTIATRSYEIRDSRNASSNRVSSQRRLRCCLRKPRYL
jgi:hypothetical protein